MKLKDFLLPLCMALLTFSLFKYFSPEMVNHDSDKSFTAPTSAKEVIEALNLDVDFFDASMSVGETITEINTGNYSLDFSNYGGLIKRLSYTHNSGGIEKFIETLSPGNTKEAGAFLVAFNGIGSTPYFYQLIENTKEAGVTKLVYKSSTDKVDIVKQFKIYDDSYRIDLLLNVAPKSKAKLKARIFFDGPFIANANFTDVQKGVVYSVKGGVEKRMIQDIQLFGKANPSLFGLEDKYFVNALVHDENGFAQRGYFKVEGVEKASAILESEYIREPQSWTLSFYLGPKESKAISKVDARLEGIFDYGILTFVSKPILYLLNLLYHLFKSYGLAIIILTILIKLLFLPFMIRSQDSKERSAEAQRKLKYLEQKYKDDPQMLTIKKAELAKEQFVPGFLMALPILMQVPILIGLSRVLSNAIELYKVSFLWIPDLSLSDPYYIFPILLGICTAIRTTQFGTAQQKVVNLLLALFFTAIASNFSAGLTIYIAVSSLLDILQIYAQKYIKL